MSKPVITEKLREFLEKKEFISVGTSSLEATPNVAPKFLLKVEGDCIYVGDYVIGKTVSNLKVNPKVSLSTVDFETLAGYQFNGTAQIIARGAEFKRLIVLMKKKEVRLSAQRIIEGVRGTGKYENYEVTFPDRVIIFKVTCTHGTRMGSSGSLEKWDSVAKK